MIDIDYHYIGLKIGKNEHRVDGDIPVGVDHTSIFGAFGVGMVKSENQRINQKWYLRYYCAF